MVTIIYQFASLVVYLTENKEFSCGPPSILSWMEIEEIICLCTTVKKSLKECSFVTFYLFCRFSFIFKSSLRLIHIRATLIRLIPRKIWNGEWECAFRYGSKVISVFQRIYSQLTSKKPDIFSRVNNTYRPEILCRLWFLFYYYMICWYDDKIVECTIKFHQFSATHTVFCTPNQANSQKLGVRNKTSRRPTNYFVRYVSAHYY